MVSWCKEGEYNAQYTLNQSYVGSSGQTLTTNVSMTPCDSQSHHQTHVLHVLYCTFGTKLIRSLRLLSLGEDFIHLKYMRNGHEIEHHAPFDRHQELVGII